MKRKIILIAGCLLIICLMASLSLAAPPEPKTKTTGPPPHAGRPEGLDDEGEFFLNNLSDNLISSAQLLDILNDESAKKPLIIDVRSNSDYINGHIPGAVWISNVAEMGNQENGQKIRRLLDEHIASGGENEIVVYCYTGHSAGLVAGVLGKRGFNIKNLRYGFNIGWVGNEEAPAGILGPTCFHSPDEPCDPENPCIDIGGDGGGDCGT